MYDISMTIVEIITLLGGLSGAAGTIYGGYRLLVVPFFQILVKLRRSFELLEKMHEEFKPNGGSSLRDAINRIETKLLVEQNARRAMSVAMDVGMFETDSEGMFVWVNQKFIDFCGLTTDEAKNYGWINGVYEEDRDRVVEEWFSAVKQKRIFRLDYGMHNTRTLDYTPVKCNAFPVLSIKNEVIGYVGILTQRNNSVVRPKYLTPD